ncbi:MAG TPA: HNH endonuclease [Gemmataceae bacterium]|nr:HNH endonuclease [Gemmataceae bacterium]
MDRALEALVWQRAGRRCEYCQVAQEHDRLPFQIDHIIAQKHGGPTRASNLCLACYACNHHKGPCIAGRDRGKLTPLFNPRRHKWGRHFRWDGPVLVGRTAIGRVTVAVLEINLEYRVAYRQQLIDEGLFPPA